MNICDDCRKECDQVEDSFNYSGTHCTHGIPGTHYTGHYVSACCSAEIVDSDDIDWEETNEKLST